MQETKLKNLCLNGIGKKQNMLWQTNMLKLIKNNDFDIYYDINNKLSDDIDIIEQKLKDNRITYINLNENKVIDLFLCDTIDNIIDYKLNSIRNIKGCFFGGIGKDNLNIQMELINTHAIDDIISDIFPDELIDIGFTCNNLFIKNFNFIEPTIPETNINHENNSNECILFTDKKNNDSIEIFTSSYCSSGEILSKNIGFKDFDNISIDKLTCKRILFNANSQNIYHAILRFALAHKISLKSLREVKLSCMRKILLNDNGFFFEYFNSKVKSLKYSIRELFKFVNNIDNDFITSPSLTYNKDTFSANINTYKEKLYNYPIQKNSLNISDGLFLNEKCNSIEYIECVFLTENKNSINLDNNSQKFIIKNLLSKISKIDNHETQNLYLHQIIINNDLFTNNLKEILVEFNESDKNSLISSIINSVTKTNIDKNISQRILTSIISHTNNPLLLSRLRLILNGTKDYEKFLNNTTKTFKTVSSTYLLATTISTYLNYYNELSIETLDYLRKLLNQSPDYPDARSEKLFCLCRIYARTKRYDDILVMLETYKIKYSDCKKLNKVIIETIFILTAFGNKVLLKELYNLINTNEISALDRYGLLTIEVMLGLNTNDCEFKQTELSDRVIHNNLVNILLYLRILFFFNYGTFNEEIEKKLKIFNSEKIRSVKSHLNNTQSHKTKIPDLKTTLNHFLKIIDLDFKIITN